MTKLLKQTGIFLVFTGMIYGAFALVTKGKQNTDLIGRLPGNVESLTAQINDEWAELNDWDESVYRSQLTTVAQCKAAEMIEENTDRILIDRINELAVEKAVSAMEREFAKKECDEKKLSINYDGLSVIFSNNNAGNLKKRDNVVAALGKYDLYRKIKSFNANSFMVQPSFNGVSGSWTPDFNSYSESIRNKRDKLKADPYYRSISHINSIGKINETDSKLSKAYDNFYKKLGDNIVSYYTGYVRNLDPGSESYQRDFNDSKSTFLNVTIKVSNAASGNDINRRLRELRYSIYG